MDALLIAGGTQQDGKRRDNRLSLLISDSKSNKPVNDLNLILFWTRVRLPPPPPFKNEKTMPIEDRYFDRQNDNPGDLLSRIEEDCILIKNVGATASSFGPGISIETPGKGRMHLDTASWNWLRPILIELTNSRKR